MSTIWRIKNIPNLLHLCAHFNSVSTRVVLIILALKLPPDIKWQTNRKKILYKRMEKTLGLESIISTTTLTNWFRGDYTSLEASAKAKEDNTILKFFYFITGFNNSTTEDNSLHTHGKEQGELACSCVKTKLMNLLKPSAQIVAKGSAESTYNTNCISTPLPSWILNSWHRQLAHLHSSQENKKKLLGRKKTYQLHATCARQASCGSYPFL